MAAEFRFRLRLLLAACALSLATIGAGTAAGTVAQVELPGHGAILLPLPDGWRNVVGRSGTNEPPRITLSAGNRELFMAIIVPRWDPTGRDPNHNSRLRLRDLVKQAADAVKPAAVERELPLVQITGGAVDGYYFSATAKSPKPGEFRNLVSGSVALGDLAVAFSILSNPGAEEEARQGLELIRDLQRLTR